MVNCTQLLKSMHPEQDKETREITSRYPAVGPEKVTDGTLSTTILKAVILFDTELSIWHMLRII